MLTGKDIGNRGPVCISPADLGKLGRAGHLTGHSGALHVFWTCHLDVQVEISPPTSLSSVLIVTGASRHIIYRTKNLPMRAGKNAVMEPTHRKSPAVVWAACGRAPFDTKVS